MPSTAQPPGLGQRFLELRDDGFYRVEIRATKLQSVDEALKTLASEVMVATPRLTRVEEQWVHGVMLPKKLSLMCRLAKLNITTHYLPKPPVRGRRPASLVPVFQQQTGSIPLTLKWTPPPDMAVWFIAHFEPANPMPWCYANSYMVWTHAPASGKPVAGVFKPPLPNVHENSKLCLGTGREHIQPSANTSLVDSFTNAYRIFQTNAWNADLLGLIDLSITEELFSVDAADNVTPLPLSAPWQDRMGNCKVSNLDFNHIPFDQLVKQS